MAKKKAKPKARKELTKSRPTHKKIKPVKAVKRKPVIENAVPIEYVTKDTILGDVIQKYPLPEVMEVFGKYGLHCIGCHVAAWETIEQGASAHGLSAEEIIRLIDELNDVIKKALAKL